MLKNRKKVNEMIAILIIGDELLSAQIQETNSFLILKALDDKGLSVGQMRLVGDQVSLIASTLNSLIKQYEYVITTGGVGPTHDDVTYQGIAKAFGVSMKSFPAYRELFLKTAKLPLDQEVIKAADKMSTLPANTKLVYSSEDSSWPLVVVNKVIILPGLPRALKKKLPQVLDYLPSFQSFFRAFLYLSTDESIFASFLKVLQEKNQRVVIGSYPFVDKPYLAMVSMTSRSQTHLKKTFEQARNYFEKTKSLLKIQVPKFFLEEKK